MFFRRCLFLAFAFLLGSELQTSAVERVTMKRAGKSQQLAGRLEVEAQDGGIMLMTPDGQIWPILPEEIGERTNDDRPFKPLAKEELGRQLLTQLPPGFKVHTTQNYVIAYNTSQAYAQWVGALYERLYRGFFTYWSHRKVDLKEPEFPLVAIVFDSQESYAAYARTELGDATKTIIGFYSMRSNHVTMYDLTGIGDKATGAKINQILSQPAAERTVATIVHEATHQLAFNSGLQVRYADIPFWVSEGLAVFFESPDLDSSKGWRTIGAVNRYNLINFKKFVRTRQNDGLTTLLTDDKRFRDAKQAPDAYAEGWALNFFLLKTKPDEYARYLKLLATAKPLIDSTPEERAAQFRSVFGDDLRSLEAEFLRYMRTVN